MDGYISRDRREQLIREHRERLLRVATETLDKEPDALSPEARERVLKNLRELPNIEIWSSYKRWCKRGRPESEVA